MKGRDTIKSVPSADLLVCFPSRASLSSRPKPICGAARPPETPNSRRPEHRPHLKRLATRSGQGSPLFWAKPKQMGSEIAEPTSPKVTCAGQIKVRPMTRPGKTWQSVMEEIERIHGSRKHKRTAWFDSLGVFKKDVAQFLTCLRGLRFDLRCFGNLPELAAGSDGEEDEDNSADLANYDESGSRTVFSKWFMVLQENQNYEFYRKDRIGEPKSDIEEIPIAPPPNALLLMRCRSAPVKRHSVSEGNREDRESSGGAITVGRSGKLGMLMNEEDEEMKKRADHISIASPGVITTGRHIVTSARDQFSRSKSWKR